MKVSNEEREEVRQLMLEATAIMVRTGQIEDAKSVAESIRTVEERIKENQVVH